MTNCSRSDHIGRKRWVILWLGVAALLVLGLVWCVRARRQQLTLRRIEDAGGCVQYMNEYHELPGPVPRHDSYLPNLFNRVGAVRLEGRNISDEEVSYVERLTSLEGLSLTGSAVTDDGLVHLRRLTALRILWLDDTEITDAGLKHLQGFSRLIQLTLTGTQVTQQGVMKLQGALPDCWIVVDDSLSDAGDAASSGQGKKR